MSWTDARISIATRMWAGGSTAGDIAQELGGMTRNAVLGMLNRRGLLKTRPKPEPGADGPTRKAPSNSAWTDERAERLKTLWVEGKSATEIAKALGGVTRLAVIGKASRMGLNQDSRRDASTPAVARRTLAKVTPPAEPARAKIICQASGAVVGTEPAPLPPAELAVVGQAVVLAHLKSACCKYPVGVEPPRGSMELQLFCAAPTGDATLSYCDQHQKVAFKVATPADKARRMATDIKAAHRDMQVRNSRRHTTSTRAVI